MEIQPIAHFHSPFTSKFGIPKQSGLVAELPGTIVFVPSQRNADALRGIDDFDYLWLIWEFSANKHGATSPVVRPPVLVAMLCGSLCQSVALPPQPAGTVVCKA
jgi:tRNA (Thr-GGU) A37 N-methylase